MPLPNNLMTIFERLPAERLLTVAQQIQQRLLTEPGLVSLKDKKEYVTQADYELQRMILDYFAQSELAGSYRIYSEEQLDVQQVVSATAPTWELILDPLDGTTAFCEQQDTWGVMVGARSLEGQLLYSWNLVSTGEVYSTTTAQLSGLDATDETLERVDVYNYGVNQTQYFPNQTSYPAAVWTGWQLYQGKLDGLIWAASTAGKKIYPAYDLIFLGALQTQGWQVDCKLEAGNVVQVAVARTTENLEKLLALRV